MIVHEATKDLRLRRRADVGGAWRGAFYHLEAPVIRVTGYDTPYPHAHEWAYFPGPDARRQGALKKVMEN